LKSMLADPYFLLPAPKTTGREYFHLDWALQRGWPSGEPPRPADLLATLTELTAVSIARAVEYHLGPPVDELLIAGGGARNGELLLRLRERLSMPAPTFADLGYDDKDRETLAMAVMGYYALNGEPNVLPGATG